MFSHTKSLEEQACKINNGESLKEQSEGSEISEYSENSENSESAENSELSEPTLAAQLEEAEKRGFMRAMAMKAEELFNRPTAGSQTFPEADAEESAASDVIVLSHIRRSVWD